MNNVKNIINSHMNNLIQFYLFIYFLRATIYKKGEVPKIDYFKNDFFPTLFF